jgi:hypothetical protein
MRWRKEGESYLLFYEGRHSLLNWDGVEFIQNLPSEFVPSALLQSEADNVTRSFFELLYHNGIMLKSLDERSDIAAMTLETTDG